MAVEIDNVFVSIIKCAKGCIILNSEQRESNPRAGKEIGGVDGVLVVFDTGRCFPEQFLKWTMG